jgi:hypothetical protein
MAARRITGLGMFDLDDIRAEVAEYQSTARSRNDMA